MPILICRRVYYIVFAGHSQCFFGFIFRGQKESRRKKTIHLYLCQKSAILYLHNRIRPCCGQEDAEHMKRSDKIMMLEESIRILAMQEEILQFAHFTNEDAWELGSLMVAEAARNHLPVEQRVHRISVRLQRNEL